MRLFHAIIIACAIAFTVSGCAKPPEKAARLSRQTMPQQVAMVPDQPEPVQVADSGQMIEDMFPTGAIRGSVDAFSLAKSTGLAGRTLQLASNSDLKLKQGEVILTFDDGPSPTYTPKILDALDKYGVKATFFMVGKMAQSHPATARSVIEHGHTVGTHTHNHEDLGKLTLASAMDSVDGGEDEIQHAIDPTGKKIAPFFRFPYLSQTRMLRSALTDQGMVIFDVDIDSMDYHKDSADTVLQRVLSRVDNKGKGIILFHDIHARTAEMLPDFLKALDERGYEVVRAVPKATGLFDSPVITANAPRSIKWPWVLN